MLLAIIGWLVSNAVFLETAVRIFLIFCMKLGYYKGRKVTEPGSWKKSLIWRYLGKGLQISPKSVLVGWLVGNAVFSETAVGIFLIFCMKLGYYKGRKVTEPDFWKKSSIWRYSRKGHQISLKSVMVGWLVGNAVFSEMAVRIFLIFCMTLGDYKGRKVTESDLW